MSLDRGAASILFGSARIKSSGPRFIFERLEEMGIRCAGENALRFFDRNPSEMFFDLSVESDEITMTTGEEGQLFLRVGLDYREESKNFNALQRLSQLAEALFDVGEFAFGYTDIEGDAPPKMTSETDRGNLHWVFWENLYSELFVKKLGRDFLLRAPGYASEDRGKLGVRYLTKELATQPYSAKQIKEIEKYFAKKNPIKVYRAEAFRME